MTSDDDCPNASNVFDASPSPLIENGVVAAKSLRSSKNPLASFEFPMSVLKLTSICCQSAARLIAFPNPASVPSKAANAALIAPIDAAIPTPNAAPDFASDANDWFACPIDDFAPVASPFRSS